MFSAVIPAPSNTAVFASSHSTPTGHDCSVRLWMLDNRTCVQEITAHRKKHDEAIHDVAFHSSQPFIASAGADALAKIFVWHHCRRSGEMEGARKEAVWGEQGAGFLGVFCEEP